jgi:signal transduction histidine kinase
MALAAMFYIGNSLDEIFGALVILVLFGAMSLLCCSFTTLIIEMEQKQHETTRLHHTMQLYEKLYQHAPVMFFSLEESTNNIVQMNKLAEQVTNSQSLGVSFLSLFQEKDIEQVNQTLQALNDEKSVVHSNNHFKLQCGVDVSLCVTRMRDTRTGQILLHVILNDVSAVAELNGKLVRAKEKAERSSLAKSQFLAMISHEIRTPLHATICSCDLLQDTELTVEQRNFADIMSTSSHLLLKVTIK